MTTANVITKKAKNINTTANLSDLLFPVEMVEQTNFRCNSDYAFDIFAFPTIDGEMTKVRVNACSSRYELVPNSSIFPVVEQILRQYNIAYSSSYRMDNHARFYVEYVIEDPRYGYIVKGSKGDAVKPKLMVQHSYNGLTKYRIIFGYFRLVCTNGLTIPVAEMKQFNLSIAGKHTSSILHSLEKLEGIIQHFAEDAKDICGAITAKYDALASSIPANVTDRINSALKEAGIIPIENSKFNTLQYIIQRAEQEANHIDLGYNGSVNDWLIYNAINGYINDSTLNIAVPEKRMEKDSAVLEYMLKTI